MWQPNEQVSGQIKDSKDSLYDSGRTDSGFLSGANIQSETFLSGEITPPKDEKETEDIGEKNETYMRLDSGVDIGLSDQLSELNIDEKESDETPWEIYFQQDDEGDTQLHIAIIRGFIEVVFSLMRMIPSPTYLDIRNDMRQTAIHLAVLTSQSKLLRRLVCAGANTKNVDINGNTALHLATAAGDLACVKALTDPVTRADMDVLQLKYQPSQRPSQSPELDMYNYEGLTCIHMAVMGNQLDILKHLALMGANIDAREYKCGRTLLHMAAEIGDKNLVAMLLTEMRADPEVPNYAGHTPYQVARRNPSFLEALVAYGAPEEDIIYSSDEEDDEMTAFALRDFHASGGIVNATA